MKWFHSFRAKLILTVFPVVAGITIATLVLAEVKFMESYRKLFEEQFDSQISSYSAARKKRTEALSKVLDKIAKEPELLEAISKKNLGAAWQTLRAELESLTSERILSDVPGAGLMRSGGPPGTPPHPGPMPAARAGGNDTDKDKDNQGKDRDREKDRDRDKNREYVLSKLPMSQQPSIDLIDPEGNFVMSSRKNLPGARGMLLPSRLRESATSAEFRRKSGKLLWLGEHKLKDILKEQEIGYMRLEYGEDNRYEQVREMYITPLRDPKSGEFLGAILFGLPLQVLAERVLYEQTKHSDLGEIMSGVWVEEGLVSTTIPKEEREIVAAHIADSIHHTHRTQRGMAVWINGERHQIYYRVLNPGSPFPLAAQVNLYPLAVMDKELGELRRDVGVLGVVSLLIALVAVLYISRGLSGPIREIVSGTHQIERGNFDVRVPVRGENELARLAASFNEMAAGLALQEKYRSVLNAVADRSVAEQLITQSGTLGGELRHVTMLFCDIRGFTALTENMPPADVIELLNEHMTALTGVAYEHGGIVDKFVGDLIMVLFGAPQSTGEDAVKAVKCALNMLRVRRELNEVSKHSLEVGIGLATGPVVAGCMGSDQRLSYTVLGHRVNLASRLCSIAQAGEIIMDDETYEDSKSFINAVPMPPMQLKGISEAVHPWRVVG
ncbi:adenylate/guanylate cyclase domain-containing protein [Prosthecobacter sp.]|uniref:adenylate/guanylate cyclase domain-containing protein n=1 Tax=Prosthecobacter sp. TaxID=1965333 RepID=UPI003782F17E